MNIFKFIKNFYDKIKNILLNEILKKILKTKRKIEILFNFYSLIDKSVEIKARYLKMNILS